MGVPAFFRWLSRKYPQILVYCHEEQPKEVDGTKVPIDTSGPNPNNVEFDNLYLDMNGIIHPCCHPEDRPAPKNEDEMMTLIFEYIDRLFAIIRPRRLLYMAIDGTAPRAKMNQQRSRRFRAAKENQEKQDAIAKVRAELEAQGVPLPPKKSDDEHFDSNCITPGTPFMTRLAECLRYYIHDRLNNDPGWKNIQVILSDANVPGEGEHKIMDYIRRQRASPSHDPNTHHCLCGADADLIMLGLATHEPNFTIIREEFIPFHERPCDLCGQYGHELKDCQGLAREEGDNVDDEPLVRQKNFIFLRISVLREYLEKELTMPNLPIKFDLERAIDDWVFMCFFVGNDFLPHLPSLEIRENAIDRLISMYKRSIYQMGGWLTDSGNVNLERVQFILTELGAVEDEIFQVRHSSEVDRLQREQQRKRQKLDQAKRNSAPAFVPAGQFAPVPIGTRPGTITSPKQTAIEMRKEAMNREAAKNLKAMLKPASATGEDSTGTGAGPASGRNQSSSQSSERSDTHQSRGVKRTASEAELGNRDAVPEDAVEAAFKDDDIRLWEDGWRERYYQAKFEVSANNLNFRYKVARSYVEGLCWVLKYYYQGVPSWKWFFPFHYAPFASDFVNIGRYAVDFSKETKPFAPLEQLMGVFPAASRKHVPATWGTLMTDFMSPIIDFYPTDFKVDLNGKKFAWQGVALLPFVDEVRLLTALADVYPALTKAENARNQIGCDYLFVSSSHRAFEFLSEIYSDDGGKEWLELDASLCYGMAGNVLQDSLAVMPGETFKSPLTKVKLPDLVDNQSISVCFRDPRFPKDFVFPATKLEGARTPDAVLHAYSNFVDSRGNEQRRPQVGFSNNMPHAELGRAGKRMLTHSLHEASGRAGAYEPDRDSSYGYRGGRGRGRGDGGGRYFDSPQQRSNYSNDGGYGGGYEGYYGNRFEASQQSYGGGHLGWQQAMSQQSQAFQRNLIQGGYNAPPNPYDNGGPPNQFSWNDPYYGASQGQFQQGRGGYNNVMRPK